MKMGTQKIILLLLKIMAIFFPVLGLSQSLFTYEEIQSGREVTFNLSKSFFSNGHIIKDIYICPEKSRFHCILGALPFAVPRDLSSMLSDGSWTIRGYKFIYRGIEHHQFLGVDMYLHRIEFDDPRQITWFLYSEQRGLVLFGTHSGAAEPAFILRSKCGFGAPSICVMSEGED